MAIPDTTFERHFSIGEIARQFHLGRETVRRLVMDQPGVIRVSMGRKQAHVHYSVPESVVRALHRRLTTSQ
jgi:hypothetical protein